MDKINAILAPLGDLSINEDWGKLIYDGNFHIDTIKTYNALRKSANKGGNAIRILPISLFGIEEEPINDTEEAKAKVAKEAKPKIFSPFFYDAVAEKWNLQLFNDYYFPIVREYIAVAESLNMKVLFELYDNCGFWPTCQHLNPWRVNIQGLYDFYSAGDIGKAYVAKCIDELGDSVEYLLGNELTHEGVANEVMDVLFSKGLKPWGCGADLDIPSEMAQTSVMKKECVKAEELWGEDFKVQLFRTCHSSFDQNSPRMIQPVAWWQYHSIQFSTDGMFPRPSVIQMQDAVKYVLDRLPVDVPQYGQGGKIRLAFENCCDTIDWDYEASLIEAIVSAAESYGLTFENKGKYPNDQIAECKIGETKIETCWDNSTIITHTCENGKWKPTGATCPVRPTNCKCIYYLNINDTLFGIPNFIKCILGKKEKYCKN
jgi:hypothetical protein